MTQIDANGFEFEENRSGEPGLILDLPGGSQVVAQPDLFAEIIEAFGVEYNYVGPGNGDYQKAEK